MTVISGNGGWDASASNWILNIDRGDRNREMLLDPAMLELAGDVSGLRILDVGCGEGRFCRIMSRRGAAVVGLEPTAGLLKAARERDPSGEYVDGRAESLPFDDESFDVVIAYLVLIDVLDYRTAIQEMARVVRPEGRLVVANINPFASTRATAWYRTESGQKLHVAVEDYYDEKVLDLEWSGIRIVNYHRPLESYMSAFLESGLLLRAYHEPRPTFEAVEAYPDMIDEYRVPLFHTMLWQKPGGRGAMPTAGKGSSRLEPLPYTVFDGSVSNPKEVTHSEIAAVVEQIVRVEGPATVRTVFERYRDSMGLGRLTGSTREAVEFGVAKAISKGLVEVVETAPADKSGNVLCVPGAPRVLIRERGPRSFEDIPIGELVELAIRMELTDEPEELAHRRVLEFYGLKRLTSGVLERLQRAISEAAGPTG